jgi:2-hydroxy-3-oxopropionate reductase
MTTVGFIGLGIMGGPMAANLVKAGFEVVGYNRSRGKVDALVERGGRGAAGVAEAVRGADVVVTMLPDSPDVESVVLGDDGVFANAEAGLLYVDASTIRPDVSARIAEEGRARGIRVLDAPVSGGEQGAVEATLSIMVGGRPRTSRRPGRSWRPSAGRSCTSARPARARPSRRPTS